MLSYDSIKEKNMNSRTKIENQLIQEIHTLPLEILKTMLHLANSIKKITPNTPKKKNIIKMFIINNT